MNNQFQFIGRLTKDIEIRANEKITIAEVNIAINDSKDKTTYVKMKAFNKTAEMLGNYVKKGDLMGFSGVIANNNWEDKEGKKHYDYDFIINRVMFLQQKPQKTEREQNQEALKQVMQEDAYTSFRDEIDDSSLPF